MKSPIDLVAIIRRSRIDAQLQRRALDKEATRRRLSLPDTFDVPDRTLWERGYRAEARRTVGLDAVKLGDALAVVRPFLEPLLIGIADGEWDPGTQTWLHHGSAHENG